MSGHYTRHPPVKVKICGLTREQDVDDAVEAGADAIGFVFVARSARNISLARASQLIARVPAFVTAVALFLDPEWEEVDALIKDVPIEVLQFHGNEDREFCRQFGKRYIKAVSMESSTAIKVAEQKFEDDSNLLCGLLLDSHQPGELGGSGMSFNWGLVNECKTPLILAGGLNPENVADAIRTVRPWAVDVSSGVESSRGIKDAVRMRHFINEAKNV